MLDKATQQGNRKEMIRGIEDVSFWVGRVVCDTFGAADPGGASEQTLTDTALAIFDGQRAIQLAKRHLLEAS